MHHASMYIVLNFASPSYTSRKLILAQKKNMGLSVDEHYSKPQLSGLINFIGSERCLVVYVTMTLRFYSSGRH